MRAADPEGDSQCMRSFARASLSASASALVVGGSVWAFEHCLYAAEHAHAIRFEILFVDGPRLTESASEIDDTGKDVSPADRYVHPPGSAESADLGGPAIADANVFGPMPW